MSWVHAFVGAIIVSFPIAVGVGAVLPDIPSIQVHALLYDHNKGNVFQERTITTDSATYFAVWEARVLDASLTHPKAALLLEGEALDLVTVPDCKGSKSYDYKSGRKVATLPLAEWVGNDKCVPGVLPPCYFLYGKWKGSEETEIKTSDVHGRCEKMAKI